MRPRVVFISERPMLKTIAESLTRFIQFGQTSLRLIRVRRVGIFFYDLPIKFRSVRLVVLLLFQLRGIVQILRFIAAAHEQQEQAGGKKSSHENSLKWLVLDFHSELCNQVILGSAPGPGGRKLGKRSWKAMKKKPATSTEQ
jgi:hypothetical protein